MLTLRLGLGNPAAIVLPPIRVTSKASSNALGTPADSMAMWTPPSVWAFTFETMSGSVALKACVAPNFRVISSFSSQMYL